MEARGANGASSTLGWVFLVINLVLEVFSAVFDQLSCPSQPRYALFGMLVSLLAVVTCIIELIHKGLTQRVVFRRCSASTMAIWCFYYPYDHHHPNMKLFGSFSDVYGLLCALSQLVLCAIKYSYHIRHASYPVKLSVLPVIFLACVVASKLIPVNRNVRAENVNSVSTETNLTQQQTPAETNC